MVKKPLTMILLLIFTSSNPLPLFSLGDGTSISPYQYQVTPLTNYGIKKVGQIDTGYGSMNDLCVVNDYLYCATPRAGLLTFDISNSLSPTIVSVFDDSKEVYIERDSNSGLTSGIFVVENIAYLADGANGLIILNMTNPNRPKKLSSYYEDTNINNIFVTNNLAFNYGSKRISIIDISNIFQPTLIGEIRFDPYTSGQIWDFAVSGNYLFVSYKDFIVYDISNPATPVEINRIENFNAMNIVISENRLYSVTSHLKILDISDPLNLIFLGECFFETASLYIQSIVASASFIYIASYKSIYVINVTNALNPHLSSTLALPSYSYSHKELALQTSATPSSLFDGIVFCADADEGLLIYNLSSPTNPVLVSRFDSGTQARDIYTDNHYAYLQYSRKFFSKSHIDILSLENPSSPSVVGSYYSNGTIRDIAIAEELMFVAVQNEPTNRCLEIIDISHPSELKLIGFYSSSISLYSLKIQVNSEGKFVVLAHDDQGFSIIDVTDTAHPALLYQGRPLGMNIVDITLEGTLLAVADGRLFGGFTLFNVSNPSFPRKLAAVGLNAMVYDIHIVGDKLFISTDYLPLVLFDIAENTAPKEIGFYSNEYINYLAEIFVNDTLAFIAREANGLIILDIGKPDKPKNLLEYRPEYSGLSYDVTIFGKYILLADGWDGLEILELIPPKISREVLLTLIILPSVVGGGIVIFIAVLVIKRQKNPLAVS